MQRINIGTRKSPLALAQAHEVRARILAAWPESQVEIVPMSTTGDNFLGQPLADIGGKGLFTKEIEEALLDGSIDIAVHSMKDVPTILPDGLMMGAILPREDVRDRLVGQGLSGLADLPRGAKFGTSSLRRASQILLVRPDVQIVPLRGNVQTRLSKLAAGDMAATMLAQAGLNRLGLDVPGAALPVAEFLPAIAQGAIGIECRENDDAMREKLAALNCKKSELAVICERAFLRVLDGSCRTPISGYAEIIGSEIHFRGQVVKPDGSSAKTVELRGSTADAQALGGEAGGRVRL
jgi:hydroxymethylbilane synthase